MAYIHSYSILRNKTLFHENKVVYSNPQAGLDVFLQEAFESLGISYPKFYKMDRLAQSGILASEPFFSVIRELNFAPLETAIVLSNAESSLDTDIRFFESTKTAASPSLFVYTLPNIVTGEIAIRQGIKGENAFFVTNEFDPGLIAKYVDHLLQNTAAKACIAGWIDVLEDKHDVFLYLAVKEKTPDALEHSAQHLRNFYNSTHGNAKE